MIGAKARRASKRPRVGVGVASSSNSRGKSGPRCESCGMDGPLDTYIGVRRPSAVVEIRNWCGMHSYYKTVNSCFEGALHHDLARMHANPTHLEAGLNIQKVEERIREENSAWARGQHSGGHAVLIKFVNERSLGHAPETWEELSKAEVEKMKSAVEVQVPLLLKKLREDILGEPEQRFGGCQMTDLEQIFSPVTEDEALKSRIRVLEDEIASLKDTVGEKDGEIASLKDIVCEQREKLERITSTVLIDAPRFTGYDR